MSTAGIVTMFLGAFIVCIRGPLLLAPAATLRWFGEAIKTKSRTRVLGAFVVLITVPMMWSGVLENSGLANVLFILGVFIFVVSIPMLVLFPSAYMSIAGSFLPSDSGSNLFGWRIVGLVSVIIGIGIFRVGMVAL